MERELGNSPTALSTSARPEVERASGKGDLTVERQIGNSLMSLSTARLPSPTALSTSARPEVERAVGNSLSSLSTLGSVQFPRPNTLTAECRLPPTVLMPLTLRRLNADWHTIQAEAEC